MKESEEEREREVEKWRGKRTDEERKLAKQLQNEVNQLASKKRELETWEEKVYDKKAELTDLKAHLKEVKENQIKLA